MSACSSAAVSGGGCRLRGQSRRARTTFTSAAYTRSARRGTGRTAARGRCRRSRRARWCGAVGGRPTSSRASAARSTATPPTTAPTQRSCVATDFGESTRNATRYRPDVDRHGEEHRQHRHDRRLGNERRHAGQRPSSPRSPPPARPGSGARARGAAKKLGRALIGTFHTSAMACCAAWATPSEPHIRPTIPMTSPIPFPPSACTFLFSCAPMIGKSASAESSRS